MREASVRKMFVVAGALALLMHLPAGAQSLLSALRPQTPAPASDAAPQAASGPNTAPARMPFVHDPSTVIQSKDKYYVFTTGRGLPMLSSPDLVTWTRTGSVFTQIPEQVHAQVPKNNGTDVWAPDIIRVGAKFYLYYAVSSWGSYRSAVALATNTTLDPADPTYKWVDQGVVVGSDGSEEMNAIDPGVVLAPDGTMWICYGSYHGSIKVLQLDPVTGLALGGANAKATAVTVARESEAADIIVQGGYFYLFVNHGSCCQGRKSQYNIRMGRSRLVTGPYLDKHGIALSAGGGSLFLAAHDHRVGPGHFGRVIEEDAKQGPDREVRERFSLHYEADLTNPGRSTLGIRPLLWSPDGWPVAGDDLAAGSYQIVSEATEDTLGMHAAEPPERVAVELGRYLALPEQQWSIEPAGGGFWKLANLQAGTALGAASAEDGLLELANKFEGTDRQLWRLDQLTDASYEICNKATNQCLTRETSGDVRLTPFANDEAHRWAIVTL